MFGKKKALPTAHKDFFGNPTRFGDLVTFVNAGETTPGLAFGRISELTKHHVVVEQIFPYSGSDRVPVMRAQRMFAVFTSKAKVEGVEKAELSELRSKFVQGTEKPVTDLLNVEAKVGDTVLFKQRRKSALVLGAVTAFKGKKVVAIITSEKGCGKNVKLADGKFMVYYTPVIK